MAGGARRQQVDDTARLNEAISSAAGLLRVLERLLGEPAGRGPATGTIGRHAPDGSEPWNSEAAGPYWDLWFGVRRTADEMRYAAGLRSVLIWGSDTKRAFDSIRNCAPAVAPEMVTEAADRIERWVAGARKIRDIDTEDPWIPVPRTAGAAPPTCPYCGTLSLRMRRSREEVRCFFPECRDLDGNPTRAYMEPGRVSDVGQLVFGDGTVVAYREQGETQPEEPA